MKLGFVSAILPEQTLAEVVQFAADTGYDCVELMCWPKGEAERRYAGVTHVDAAELSDTEADEILQCVSDAGDNHQRIRLLSQPPNTRCSGSRYL